MPKLRTGYFAVIASLLLVESTASFAAPTVTSLELVSSARVDRTRFDFTYRIRAIGDEKAYRNASFAVTSSQPSIQIIDGQISIGQVESDRYFLPPDTFTIRHDRSVIFNPSAIAYAFSGEAVGKPTPSNPVIVEVAFLESGGRLLHTGSFPIQQSAPVPNTVQLMRALVLGDVTAASYRFLDGAGQVIAQAPLLRVLERGSESSEFVESVFVPSVRFQIEIIATSPTVGSVSSRSAWYSPPAVSLKIVPVRALLERGGNVPVRLQVQSLTGNGAYQLKLVSPAMMSSPSSTWSLNLAPGQLLEVETSLSASATTPAFSRFLVLAEIVPAGTGLPVSYASLPFWVE